MEQVLISHIRQLVTMTDADFSSLVVNNHLNAWDAYNTLMSLVNNGTVIMSNLIDATGRTIGGIYSLKG